VNREPREKPSAQVVTLQGILDEKKAAILKRWREQILQSYPTDSVKFLQGEKDQFANPVGHTIARDTKILLDGILSGRGAAENDISTALNNLTKLRAVQDFSAADAVGFIFSLKKIIRDELASAGSASTLIAALDERIDNLMLAAFDWYTRHRESIYEIRVRMIRNRTIKLLERTNLFDKDATHFGILDNGDGDESSLKGGTGT
jgi:hypothetical protein